MSPVRRRPGFSLIEALVVLAIGGMALAIIFSIGVKAGDTGFALGRRAMAAADADVAVSDLRAIVRSIALRPPATMRAGVDRPLVGTAERLEADAVMERATLCAPQGWAGRLVLSVEDHDGAKALFCQAGARPRVLLIALDGDAPGLSYSQNGSDWSALFATRPAEVVEVGGFVSQTLWVRVNGGRAADVIEMAYSGQPSLWVRQDGGF